MIKTNLMKNRKPVLIVWQGLYDFEILSKEITTQVKVIYPNGDSEYCGLDEIIVYRESMEFKD